MNRHFSFPRSMLPASFVSDVFPRNMWTLSVIRYRRNRRNLQGVPHVVSPVPDDEPNDTDVPADDPGVVVVPPVDVSAGPNTPLVYTRNGRAVVGQ